MELVNKAGKAAKALLSSRWLPWALVGLLLLEILLALLLSAFNLENQARLVKPLLWGFGIIGLGSAFLVSNHISRLHADRNALNDRLIEAERKVGDAYQRLESIFQVSQKFVEANDENEVIEPILFLFLAFSGAEGASFVPLDEHGQPQSALSKGELPFPVQEAWIEHLASQQVRERCRQCEIVNTPVYPTSCPLLTGPFSGTRRMLCIPVRRGEREYGILNLFLSDEHDLDERTHQYLRALADDMALGLEGISLRRRELSALRQTQVLRQRTDLSSLLSGHIENLVRSLDADFGIMVVPPSGSFQAKVDLTTAEFPSQIRPFVDGILHGVMVSSEPVLLGEVSGDLQAGAQQRPFVRSLIAAPLLSTDREVFGAVLVGSRRARSFHQRQLALLLTITGQVALIVQNARLMAEIEFKSMIQERARLAREIHDGLAQTIGFLKLQASQLRAYLAHGDLDRARQNADLFYATLNEAYQDARQAIDGLRISPDECGLNGWLEQTTAEFGDLTGLPVHLEAHTLQTVLSPEIQAQLIRIMQEALSNVRKHAQPNQVWVGCRESSEDLIIEVRDDGQGFSPEDISYASRHGLRSMRERAELIGADFQVVSRQHEGTIVRLRLPVKNLEETVK